MASLQRIRLIFFAAGREASLRKEILKVAAEIETGPRCEGNKAAALEAKHFTFGLHIIELRVTVHLERCFQYSARSTQGPLIYVAPLPINLLNIAGKLTKVSKRRCTLNFTELSFLSQNQCQVPWFQIFYFSHRFVMILNLVQFE